MNDVLSMKIFSFTLGELIRVLCLWLLCIVVGKVILRIIDRGFSRLKVDPNLQAFLHSAIKLIIWFVVAVIVADSLGIPVTSLVALLSVVPDGSAHITTGKKQLAGSTLKVNEGLRILVEKALVPFEIALDACTINPMRYLGMDDHKGRIKAGFDADIVVLKDDYSVVETYCRGKAQL